MLAYTSYIVDMENIHNKVYLIMKYSKKLFMMINLKKLLVKTVKVWS